MGALGMATKFQHFCLVIMLNILSVGVLQVFSHSQSNDLFPFPC
uniref:Uncharacterized protein n=1 Tax=Anguilla anguilla TaxID=7936 RepID=A0A0E9TTD3_ANGAN